MGDFLDLGDYDSVCAHAGLLTLAFGLPVTDPNSMPVTRDLSGAKRAAIVAWLGKPGPDGKPLLGTPPEQAASAAVSGSATNSPAPAASGPDTGHWLGGKAAAASRRAGGRQQ